MDGDWYKNAVIYSLQVATFFDGNGDGVGDLEGARSKLDYLARLGVNCLWLMPVNPSPLKDWGYDVTDYYGIRPALGDPGDFVEFMREAHDRGMHVIFDLVLQHTSDEHPWFIEARRSRSSPYHEYFVWADELPPEETWPKPIVFRAASDSCPWTFLPEVGRWYRHHFYPSEPDLDSSKEAVRAEFRKIVSYWLEMGVDGFRIDAAPYLSQQAAPAYEGNEHGLLKDLRSLITHFPRRMMMAEADVEAHDLDDFFGQGDEMHVLLNFYVAGHLALALARREAGPVEEVLRSLPPKPTEAQWANFIRNHDELDLERLTREEQEEVYRAFAADPDMRLYGRGIRRRLAPMLGNDQRRLRQAYSVLLSLPGAPIILYGDEIGMGDDLSLDERNSVRTPMQWSEERNGGFSDANESLLCRQPVSTGEFAFEKVNVAVQRPVPDSMLNWMSQAISTRRECPEIGLSEAQVLETGEPYVLALRYDSAQDSTVIFNNFSAQEVSVEVTGCADLALTLEMLRDGRYDTPGQEGGRWQLRLSGYGYRWFRAHHERA